MRDVGNETLEPVPPDRMTVFGARWEIGKRVQRLMHDGGRPETIADRRLQSVLAREVGAGFVWSSRVKSAAVLGRSISNFIQLQTLSVSAQDMGGQIGSHVDGGTSEHSTAVSTTALSPSSFPVPYVEG
jgi:hypothetical protein